MIKRTLGALMMFALVLFHGGLLAQAWPSKPVKLVVPGGAGSATDIAARLVAESLGKIYGQPFVVENKAGANGIIGTDAVGKAANDGHTLLFTYAAAHVVNQSLYEKLPYDVTKDLIPIVQIGAGGNLLLVPPSMPVKDLKEFIAYVKSKPPNTLSYGSWGNGSGGHLSMEALKQQAGLKLVHVPYKTSSAANTDLMGGQLQAGFSGIGSALPLVEAGKLKAIAVSGPYRVPQLPHIKTMSEQDIKFDVTAWYGIFAPTGTQAAIVNSVNKEVVKLLTTPEVVERWKKLLGLSEMPTKTPDQFAETVRADIREWGQVVRAGNIKAD